MLKCIACVSLISNSRNILSVEFSLYIGKIVLGFISQKNLFIFVISFQKKIHALLFPLSNVPYISFFPL